MQWGVEEQSSVAIKQLTQYNVDVKNYLQHAVGSVRAFFAQHHSMLNIYCPEGNLFRSQAIKYTEGHINGEFSKDTQAVEKKLTL